jgi:glycosyltransferase involved in cell wall biosynthesis
VVEEAARRSPNVRYDGFVTGPDLERVISGARCIVVPSLWYENAPAVILDAYAHGRPVVASRIGGIPEIVEHEVTGLLVEPGNLETLAAAIDRLEATLPAAVAMGSAGRQRLAERHSVSGYLDAMEQIYRQALA